jgi:hypothetical protein
MVNKKIYHQTGLLLLVTMAGQTIQLDSTLSSTLISGQGIALLVPGIARIMVQAIISCGVRKPSITRT